MKKETIIDALDLLDDNMIESTAAVRNKKRHSNLKWMKWGTIAACLCLAVIGALRIFHHGTPKRNVQQWSEQFYAKDYFKYSNKEKNGNTTTSTSLADKSIPYAKARSFSHERKQLESEGVIPVMENHPLFDCEVFYNEDGSIYSINFSWHSRGNIYSDLSITAGYQEVEQMEDTIFVEIDDNGNIIPPAVTITERDGIQIISEGKENRKKTITFQNDSGWYQMKGSFNDNYTSVVELLDWIFEHPVDFTRFPMENGDEYTYHKLTDFPDAFADYIPNFEAFGYINEYTSLLMKNGEPYSFEGNYIAHADEKSVKEGTYSDIEGWTNIHWCIDTEPDYYDLQDSLGELENLTEQVIEAVLKNESNFAFMWNGYFIRVYTKSATEAWDILETLQSQ